MPVYPGEPKTINQSANRALHQRSPSEGHHVRTEVSTINPLPLSILATRVVSSLARLFKSSCTRSRLAPA